MNEEETMTAFDFARLVGLALLLVATGGTAAAQDAPESREDRQSATTA